MIGYLEGQVLHYETDGILLLVGNVGYEILLNPLMMEKVRAQTIENEQLSLYIYYHQTERQPKPVLIGFETLDDKQFFQAFITVDAIGPMKAVKAMSRPVADIASAIEKKEVSFLTGLSGVGKRTAEKIIATLHGKVELYIGQTTASKPEDSGDVPEDKQGVAMLVADVLVTQLGHSHTSAKRMIHEALERNDTISTPEELFDEIYQENR